MTPEQIAYGTKMAEAVTCACAIARGDDVGPDEDVRGAVRTLFGPEVVAKIDARIDSGALAAEIENPLAMARR